MWKNIARTLGLEMPDEQLERISPTLDALWTATRRALDRDLSAVDPAVKFDPELGGES